MAVTGKVYLIGAGPGDPGLLTVKGLRLIKNADIIVYDYLVNSKLLNHANEQCEIIYVGKKSGHREISQSNINKLLVNYAKKGKIVARLKGGDPFIFGRGAEEASELSKNKIPFEIVPGVSSDYSVPEYAGIPLTHRKASSTVAVITGHEDPVKSRSNIPWDALSKIGTLIVLMGIKNLHKIIDRLKKNGKPDDTPIAIITHGTYPKQKTVAGTFKNITKKLSENKIEPPGIIVIGEVVKYRNEIQWFENRPLFGKRIVVTRPVNQSYHFIDRLEDQGAETFTFPTIEIYPPKSWKKLDISLNKITDYSWIIFTSSNGVKYFFRRFEELKINHRSLANTRFAVIGEKTKETLSNYGYSTDIIPSDYRAEGLIYEFKKINIVGQNILIPRAKEARQILPLHLKKLGAVVEVVTAYQNIKPESLSSKKMISELRNLNPDVITFTSPSTVKNFYSVFRPYEKSFKNTIIASIGPITSRALKQFGIIPHITSPNYTVDDLADEISRYYDSKNPVSSIN